MTTNRSPNFAAEIEAVKKVYAGLNRNDVSAILEHFDPSIVRIEPAENPSQGIFRGLAEVSAHIEQARNTWEQGSCELERTLVAGDKVIAFAHVRVKVKNRVEWAEGHTADVFTFRNGKIVEFRTFFNVQEALEWAGVEE
ncbi:MAG: nuclear transport factor 2 family protein [Bdellovibrionota bacterium]